MEAENYDKIRDELEEIRRQVTHTKRLVVGVIVVLACLAIGPNTLVTVSTWLIPMSLLLGAVLYGGLWLFEKLVFMKHGSGWGEKRLEEALAAYNQQEGDGQKEAEGDEGSDGEAGK